MTPTEHKLAVESGGRRWKGLPEITVYGKDNKAVVEIGQSNACLRYIGSLCALYPSANPLQAALIDEVLDSVEGTSSMPSVCSDSA